MFSAKHLAGHCTRLPFPAFPLPLRSPNPRLPPLLFYFNKNLISLAPPSSNAPAALSLSCFAGPPISIPLLFRLTYVPAGNKSVPQLNASKQTVCIQSYLVRCIIYESDIAFRIKYRAILPIQHVYQYLL